MTAASTTGRVITTVPELRAATGAVRAGGGTVGFFGTSGNLHEGHLAIIERMAGECDMSIIPLFLEPVPGLLEFGPGDGYERDFDADSELAFGVGLDVVFRPTVAEMYPRLPMEVRVGVDDGLAYPWDNAEDPGFIRMSATAILKYWNLVGPCRYYAGEKDWVPLVMLRRMIEDLSPPTELVACPIVRELDGLCAASRNRRLTPEERVAAPTLYAALREGVSVIEAGERRAAVVRELLRERVSAVAPAGYAEVVDAHSLRRIEPLVGDLRLLVSASFSRTTLFDNFGVTVT
jgi:pantoate--beta-alanine ligase